MAVFRPFYPESSEMVLLFVGDAVAFHRLLYGLVVSPLIYAPFLYEGQYGIILPGKGGGKIPGDHHVDVVFIGMDIRHGLWVGYIEILIKKVLHQHAYGKPDGVDLI